MAVYSPINGSLLEPTSINNVYNDPVYGANYILNDGVLTKISSPASGGDLKNNSDGTYYDPYIGQNFSFDPKRNAFIPHYIPDETVEPAHIEGDFLVGDNTGRKFEIDSNGHILTPEEISFQIKQGQDLARINQMEMDGTIDAYLEKAMMRSRKVQQELEAMRKDGTINAHFQELMNEKKDSSNHILEQFDEIVANLGLQSVETLDELLSYFNAGHVQIGGRAVEAYSDPLIASKINARYRVLTGLDHPIFMERISAVISSYQSSKEQFLKIGGYFNESYFDDLENIKEYVAFMQKGKEISSDNNLRDYHKKMGLEFPEQYYELNELKEKAAKGEVGTAELKRLCEIAFGSDTIEARMIYDAMIQSGRVLETIEETENEKRM